MEELRLKATLRKVTGKKTRFLRRQGITPAHLYGHDIESLALQCNTDELRRLIARAGRTRLVDLEIDDGKPRSVFVREIQKDALSQQLLHVDFYEVKKTEKIAVAVPIVFVGEAPAMKGKGRLLVHGITSLNIECLPGNVPPQIEVDLSRLQELEQAITVKDIALGPDITVNADPEQLVVKVSEVLAKEEAVAEVAPAVEEAVAAEAEAKAEAGAKAPAPAEGEKPEKPAKESKPQ